MLVDFENTGFINVHPSLCEEKNTYIPWGFIKGDISEQSDLMELLANIEGGLTAEQISLLVNVERDIAALETSHELDITHINAVLDTKANAADVYTKDEVDEAIQNIDVNITGYATEDWVKQQGYLTEHQSLANYYTKSEVDNLFENVEVNVDLTGYATEEWVVEQGYLTEHQSLDGYATESWVKEQNYLTEHQSLANYYTKSEVDSAVNNKVDINKIWSGTQDEWDAMSADMQNSYIIAMIEI